jgi:hypothetical protein
MVNKGDESQEIRLMEFIYLHDIEQRNLLNCFKRGRKRVEGER